MKVVKFRRTLHKLADAATEAASAASEMPDYEYVASGINRIHKWIKTVMDQTMGNRHLPDRSPQRADHGTQDMIRKGLI